MTETAKPALLTVDDDPGVSRAVARDLRAHFGDRYRIVRAQSGSQALDAVRELVLRHQPVALLLADHRMPEMNGVEFLEQAMDLVPQAKRVLLTAYADTDAAIAAINVVDLDHYLLKPWDPPAERLYPVLEDLLSDWEAHTEGDDGAVQVVGHRYSAGGHAVRDFLARNQIAYRWLDLETDAAAQTLLNAAGLPDVPAPHDLPLVVLPGGQALRGPKPKDLAERLGLRTTASSQFYDVVVIGGGPAGLGAAVYAASEGLQTVLVEAQAAGGQAGQSSRIENYLGFPSGISGSDLARRAAAQAQRFSAEMLSVNQVTGLAARGPARVVSLAGGAELSAHAVVIASGVSYTELQAPGAAELTGKGVYYGAAATEALSCRGEEVYLIGGANSAGQAAVYFASYATTVTLLVRAESLTSSMSAYLIDQLDGLPNVRVRTCTEVTECHGTDHLTQITVRDNRSGDSEQVDTGHLFVFIGAAPRTDWVGAAVARDARGYLLTGAAAKPHGWPERRDPGLLETSLPGVFAAGDVRAGSVKRVAAAVGEGALAVTLVHGYLTGR